MVWSYSQFFCVERKYTMKDELKKNEKQEADIEKAREEAFLEGYKYAIKILTEGLVKKEKTE